ncbi:MAG TPA: type II secretion system F family protein [Geminicoccus sp.]|jgi:general secretion pathway protein F|uniref:type II secretion system F family protein n=1 Tax=Geminicoccus sp. TaxID=2024832 RepID=UPI002E34868E|nr:type II secretion system F family protein [Geminicoccus sp.]HEX2528720.1 type II secretion system F family protein [Geminicoccus sp.]
MASFRYRALTAAGQMTTGDVEGANRAAAVRALEAMGLVPVDITEGRAGGQRSGEARASERPSGGTSVFGVSAAMVTQFTRELATLVSAGQTLAWSLETLAQDETMGRLGGIINQLLGEVKSGKSFTDALSQHPKLFPRSYLGMVRAGEATGALDSALLELAALREREERTRAKLIGAMTYPILLAVVAIGSLLVLLTVVVPQFEPLFADAGASLPASTQVTLAVARFVEVYGIPMVVGLGILIVLLVAATRQESSARVFHRILLRLPLIGGIARARATAQTTRVMGSLLAGGVELPQALQLTRDVVGNRAVGVSLDRALSGVRQGRPLWMCLNDGGLLAPQAIRLCRIGEETGRLGMTLQQAASWFETRLEERIQRILSIMEPLIVVTLGVTVAGVVLSILAAVLAVNDLAGVR